MLHSNGENEIPISSVNPFNNVSPPTDKNTATSDNTCKSSLNLSNLLTINDNTQPATKPIKIEPNTSINGFEILNHNGGTSPAGTKTCAIEIKNPKTTIP